VQGRVTPVAAPTPAAASSVGRTARISTRSRVSASLMVRSSASPVPSRRSRSGPACAASRNRLTRSRVSQFKMGERVVLQVLPDAGQGVGRAVALLTGLYTINIVGQVRPWSGNHRLYHRNHQ
jgi:hypothetical protein